MRELVFAFRMLIKTPVVTTVAILSLGLGIGANTAVFGMFNQVLLRSLPVESPHELVNLAAEGLGHDSVSCNNAGSCDEVFSYPMYLDLARNQQVFSDLVAHRSFRANVGYQGETVPVSGLEVSGNYFGALGLRPAAGRLLAPADTATVGGASVTVLSFDYWRTRFDGDDAIVGQPLVVNGQTLAVVGVAPPRFDGTTRGTRASLFVPITLRAVMEPPFDGFSERGAAWAYLFGRLRPGVSIEAARSGIDGPFQAIVAANESSSGGDEPREPARIMLAPGNRGQSSLLGRAATPLTILQAVAVVVLLIACANVANLLLARAAGRSSEMAVRLSIGAGRGQLVRQLLVESCLLAGLGGVAGLLLYQWSVGILMARLPFGTLDPAGAQLGLGVLLFAVGLSLATGVLFGLFPALHATRPDLASALKGQAGQPSGARSAARFRTSLVVVQIALSMGLLTTAGLFTKSLANVSRVELGVDVDQVITFRLDPQRIGYTPPASQALFETLLERLDALPGVVSASAGLVPLIAGSTWMTSITVEGYEPGEDGESARYNEVAPGYFRTTGMALLAGRDFTDADTAGAPGVAIVNEAFARRYRIGPNPVGRRMGQGSATGTLDMEIVGLVRDAKYSSVRQDVPPVFFTPYRQNERIGALAFYARARGEPEPLLEAVRPLVASLDPDLPVQQLNTMPDQIAQNIADDRMMSVLSASFAGLATALAAIGLYGVLSYTVSQRTREFGLRMALGASPAALRRLVLRHVMKMTLVGGVIGLGLAIAVGLQAQAQLFEMQSTDPLVLVSSVAAMALVALAAGLVPSLRASRIDPMRALRWE